MATTPSGWPYPQGTDFVVDGDNAIRALADMLEARRSFATFTVPTFSGAAGGFGIPKGLVLVPARSMPNATAILPQTDANGGVIVPWAGEWEVNINLTSSALITSRAFINTVWDTGSARSVWSSASEDAGSAMALCSVAAPNTRIYWQVFQNNAVLNFTGEARLSYRGPYKS